MVSNARRLQSLFSQMLAAGGRHSFSMTHGLSELTASTVQARLTPLTGFEKKKRVLRETVKRRGKCTNKSRQCAEGIRAQRRRHACTQMHAHLYCYT